MLIKGHNMKNNSDDRRVRKTKKILAQGLAKLLQTKPINEISVREISDLVDINRGTFYLHYRDIFDMTEQIENEMFEEFSEIVKNMEVQDNSFPKMDALFSYMSDNAELFGALLGPNGDIAFVNRLKDVVYNKGLSNWKQIYGETDDHDYEFYNSFMVSGCIGVFQTWLSGGIKETPNEMAALINFIINGYLEKKMKKRK
jgi:AcrR family transcriptional regulator